jgi:hypothetical protein
MEAFGQFLAAVEAKYGATGELPDGKPPVQPKPAKVTVEKVTPEQLGSAIQDIKGRLARNEPVDRAAVTHELAKFEGLKAPDLERVVKDLGSKSKPKSKAAAITAIVDRLLAAPTAAARSDV